MTPMPDFLRDLPDDTVVVGDVEALCASVERGEQAQAWEDLCACERSKGAVWADRILEQETS